MEMDKFAPQIDRLSYIARDLSLVPKEERRALFVERAKAVGEMVRDGLLDAAAVHKNFGRSRMRTASSGCPAPAAKSSSQT
jgi:hypothetical protein